MTVRTVNWDYRCPEGHTSRMTWSALDFCPLLAANQLNAYCVYCDKSRAVTPEEGASLAKQLA
jgi:hypothetical protein